MGHFGQQRTGEENNVVSAEHCGAELNNGMRNASLLQDTAWHKGFPLLWLATL
jgi:hypothetical protein